MPLEPTPAANAGHHPVVTFAARRLVGRDPLTPEARALREPPTEFEDRQQAWRWLHARECVVGGGNRDHARRKLSFVTSALIPIDRLMIEPDLMTTKWFDYRFLHPAAATGIFATYYEKAYRATYRRNYDVEVAEFKNPLAEVKDFFLAPVADVSSAERRRTISALWSARQHADAIGAPYDFYLYEAFEWFARRGKRSVPPRPNQLCRTDLASAVGKKWSERCGETAARPHATDPRYRNELYHAEFMQDDYRRWIVHIYGGLLRAPRYIGYLCLSKQLLPTDLVKATFGDAADEAIATANSDGYVSEPMPGGAIEDTRPGCHGVPYAFRKGSDVCWRCLHQTTCSTRGLETMATVEMELGDCDPLAQRKRDQARERQQRRRAKFKTAARKGS